MSGIGVNALFNAFNIRAQSADVSAQSGLVWNAHSSVGAGREQLVVAGTAVVEVRESDRFILSRKEISFRPGALSAGIRDNGIIGYSVRTPALIERSKGLS